MSKELAEKIVDLFAENRYDSPLITQIRDMLPELEALLPKWIPVTERLPPERGIYIATVTGSNVSKSVFFDGYTWHGFEKCVTHWQPLPAPASSDASTVGTESA